jgi:hypothetical protein
LRAARANFSSGTKQSSVQRRTAAKRNDAEKTAEKIMAVVLNGLKSLYREQRQARSIILLPALQITEAKEADALFFLFSSSLQLAPFQPHHLTTSRPGDVRGKRLLVKQIGV